MANRTFERRLKALEEKSGDKAETNPELLFDKFLEEVLGYTVYYTTSTGSRAIYLGIEGFLLESLISGTLKFLDGVWTVGSTYWNWYYENLCDWLNAQLEQFAKTGRAYPDFTKYTEAELIMIRDEELDAGRIRWYDHNQGLYTYPETPETVGGRIEDYLLVRYLEDHHHHLFLGEDLK